MSKSGCHNKVKWILSQCKWNSDWVSVFTFNLINDLNLLYYSNTTPCPNEKYNLNWINSWSDACEMANWYAGNSCQNLYHLITKYPWFNNAYNQKINQKIHEVGTGNKDCILWNAHKIFCKNKDKWELKE